MLNPHRLWSLWEIMEPFSVARIHINSGLIQSSYTMFYSGNLTWPVEKTHVYHNLAIVEKIATELNLVSVLDQIPRIKMQFENPAIQTSPAEIAEFLKALDDRMMDDLNRIAFGYIPHDKATFYESLNFGVDFNKKFPLMIKDVKSAGTCYAHGLNTACVFHLMRVMEAGVWRFAKALRVKRSTLAKTGKLVDKPWGGILNEMDAKIKALPVSTRKQKTRHEKISGIYSYLSAVKDAWRNTTMHPRNSYEEFEALALIHHVKSFMTGLARF